MGSPPNPWIRFFLATLTASLLVGGLSWANYRFVRENPGGNDFLVHWVGTRALLMDGLSPYSDEVALRIQTLAYGRPARPGEHELRVAYPLYSAVVFLPFALINNYILARTAWMSVLELALLGMAFVSLRVTNWKPSRWVLLLYYLFTLLWYHSVRPLVNGNAVVLVALSLAGVLLALKYGRDELAGILLGFATIKPQVVIVMVIYVFIWTLTIRRWRVIIWTVISVMILSVGGMIFVSDWPLQNLWEILRYAQYNPPGTAGAVFETWSPAAGSKFGWFLTALVGLLLAGEWLASRDKGFRWFLWTCSLTLVAGQWIGIQTDPGNFIILFVPLVLVFSVWEERWGLAGKVTTVLSMLLLFLGLWALFLRTVDFSTQPQQNPILFFPLPAFLLFALYWVRWWAIRPGRFLIDVLQENENY